MIARHGRLDAVVANAGVGDSNPLGKITEEQFDSIYGVNVKGVLFTVQLALPLLQSTGGTAVIIGSTASIQPLAGMSLYGGAKAADGATRPPAPQPPDPVDAATAPTLKLKIASGGLQFPYERGRLEKRRSPS